MGFCSFGVKQGTLRLLQVRRRLRFDKPRQPRAV